MAVEDWSSVASENTTIDGTNIDEGCPPGGLNNAIRSVMAAVRVMYNNLPNVSTLMPKAGGVFSGTQPTYTGRGAYLHSNDSANASGQVYYLTTGTPLPTSPVNGMVVFFYS
jgi:hypothetical protein